MVKPKPNSDTEVRSQASSVRSVARRVRIQAKWLSEVVRTSKRAAGGTGVFIVVPQGSIVSGGRAPHYNSPRNTPVGPWAYARLVLLAARVALVAYGTTAPKAYAREATTP